MIKNLRRKKSINLENERNNPLKKLIDVSFLDDDAVTKTSFRASGLIGSYVEQEINLWLKQVLNNAGDLIT